MALLFASCIVLLNPHLAFATTYQPGETLNPACGPTDSGCGVANSVTTQTAGSFVATSSTASVLPYASSTAITVSGTASTSNFFVSNTFTLGTVTGFLKAVAGVVSTALVNLASDVTGILSIGNGGTGTSTAPSYGKILVGNAASGYDLIATSSLGVMSTWGAIQGTLANQTDLQNAFDTKLSLTSWYATTTGGLTQGTSNKYYSTNLFAGSLSGTTTSALAEGTNLYFTNNRVASVIAGTTTDALPQGGTNKYYSTNLFAADLAGTTTTALGEGANKYYTDARVGSYISGSSTIPHIGGSAFGDLLYWTGSLWSKVATSSLGIALSDTVGTLSGSRGGTGLSSITNNQLLVGGAGNTISQLATSSLGLLTTDVLEGSNLYFTNNRVASVIAGTTTTALAEGSNLYFTNARAGSYISSSTTIPHVAGSAYGDILSWSGSAWGTRATSTMALALTDTTGTLSVARGGTGAASFGQGWIFSDGGTGALSASTSPTLSYITATSTTATSTFANGINITGGCFAKNGVCIGAGGTGSDLQYVTSYKPNDTFTNITSGTTTLTTVAITPSTATGDVVVRAGVTFTSSSVTDQPVSIAIRQTNCTDTSLQSTLFTIAAAAGNEIYNLQLNYVAVDPGTSSQTYAFCISTSAGDTDVSAWDMSAVVIDTGADLAEIYTTNDSSLEAGDVVSFDPALKTGVKKSMHAYDANLLGVVSTRPGMVIGGVDKEGVKAMPVALSGRVPVKVVTENGAIEPGDYLTSSSVPGAAMKNIGLGPVIGQAMSAYSGEGVGMVEAFIKNFDFVQGALLMGDISSSSTRIAAIQSETARDPIAIITQKITDGIQFLTDFVVARVTAIRGYFDEVFAKKIHTEQICVKKSDGTEVCVSGDQVQKILDGEKPISSTVTVLAPVETQTAPKVGDTATASSTVTSDATSSAPAIVLPLPVTEPIQSTPVAPVVSEPFDSAQDKPTPAPEPPPVPINDSPTPVSENGTI